MIVVLMGVSGSGKTTIGKILARDLGWTFIEADDYHPPANIEKMKQGIPLNDDDRRPWLAAVRRRVDEVLPLVPESIQNYQARLTERFREALGSADDERIRAEIAVFAQKIDVGEEVDRLRAHLAEVERTLARGGAAGKRLDFLAQELNREANTLASKAASQAVSDCALELKLLVEQVREQVQNIE